MIFFWPLVALAAVSAAGSVASSAMAAGKKPKIPGFPSIDPSKIQEDTIRDNLANFSQASRLASETNAFNQEQLDFLRERALPGGRQKIQENILSELRGELPRDVSNQVQRFAAETSVAGGTAGSEFSRKLTARDLGLTSLQLTQRGLMSAERWLAASTARQMDVTSMFFSPQQRLAAEANMRAQEYERNLLANQVRAAPDPSTIALSQGMSQFFNNWSQISMLGAGAQMANWGSAVGTTPAATPATVGSPGYITPL